MSSNAELVALARQRLYPNYKPAPLAIVRGSGCELFDADGRRWLDLCAGVAVCSVGHAHPVLVRAIAEQAARVMHVSNYFYNEPNIRLADELSPSIEAALHKTRLTVPAEQHHRRAARAVVRGDDHCRREPALDGAPLSGRRSYGA